MPGLRAGHRGSGRHSGDVREKPREGGVRSGLKAPPRKHTPISDLIAVAGLINLDFADVKAVMEKSGNAIIGIGIGMGEERAIEAAKQAVSSPLLETSISGATDAIINITGGLNLTLFEAEQAAEVVRAAANTDINTIFGSVINENLTDEVIVTVIATGFDKNKEKEQLYPKTPSSVETQPVRRTKPEVIEPTTPKIEKLTDDDDDDSKYELPPFLRDRNY